MTDAFITSQCKQQHYNPIYYYSNTQCNVFLVLFLFLLLILSISTGDEGG